MIRTTTNHPVRECPDCGTWMESIWLVLDEDMQNVREALFWCCLECGLEEEQT